MDDKAAKRDKKPKASAKRKTVPAVNEAPPRKDKSDAEFRQLFDSINLSMASHRMVYDPSGKAVDYIITDVNPVFEKNTGFSKKQVVGKSPTELYAVDKAPNLKAFVKVVATGKPVSFETFFPDMHIYAQVFVFSTKPASFTTIISDITEHKKLESRLQESEERYRALVDLAPDAILVHRDGHIYYANTAAVRMFGADTFNELVKHNLLDLIVPEDRENARTSVKTVEDGQTTVMTERRALRLDGQQWMLEATGSPVRWNNEICVQVIIRDVTERKKLEAALATSESNFRYLWQTMSVGVVYQDAEGKIVSMNPAAERILGQNQRDYLGSSSQDHEHFTIKEDKSPFPGDAHPSMVALKTGKNVNNVVMGVYNPLDRSYHWINVSAIPLIRPNETKPYQVYTIFDDITERKNSEEQLRQRAEELKTVMDLVPAAIWVAHDPECHNITGNQTANEFYEAKEGENVSAGPASGEPVPPRRFFRNGKELKAEELPMQEAAARNRTVEGSEFDVEVPSGKSLTLMGAASPLRDEKGNVRGAVAAFLDITARRAIEELNYEHLHILEQANVFVRDMEGKIIFWNMGAEKIYGYSMDDAIGRISNELLKTEFPEPLPDLLRNLTAKGKWEGDLIHTRKDGVKIVSSSVWTYYQAGKNNPGMIIEAGTDVTERKKAEEAAAEYAKNLEIANKELEAFSYSVSHDLQAPLRAMDSFSELLIEDYGQKIDETGQDYLNRIRKASQTMSQLINDMLKLSRIIRSTMQEEMVDISELVKSIAVKLQESQPERKVKFVITPDILAPGDPGLLDIALSNLLENAWKYTSKNPDALIEFGETQQNGGKEFFIRDNGIGFDMTYSDKLFQPFQRLHTDKEYPGTGIGLAIVQRIIRRHGGLIRAESEVGKSTTFYFTIGQINEVSI